MDGGENEWWVVAASLRRPRPCAGAMVSTVRGRWVAWSAPASPTQDRWCQLACWPRRLPPSFSFGASKKQTERLWTREWREEGEWNEVERCPGTRQGKARQGEARRGVVGVGSVVWRGCGEWKRKTTTKHASSHTTASVDERWVCRVVFVMERRKEGWMCEGVDKEGGEGRGGRSRERVVEVRWVGGKRHHRFHVPTQTWHVVAHQRRNWLLSVWWRSVFFVVTPSFARIAITHYVATSCDVARLLCASSTDVFGVCCSSPYHHPLILLHWQSLTECEEGRFNTCLLFGVSSNGWTLLTPNTPTIEVVSFKLKSNEMTTRLCLVYFYVSSLILRRPSSSPGFFVSFFPFCFCC